MVYKETAFWKIYHYEGTDETSPSRHFWTPFQAADYILEKQHSPGIILLYF